MSASRPAPTPADIDPVFRLILDLPLRQPAARLPRPLAALFRELAGDASERSAEEVEELIWTLWISHEDRGAEEIMGSAVEAMASGVLDQARSLFDRLVERHPDWAEAWNKRATLAFIERRDSDSLADIRRTLELEPRHFGAVAGFGQICLRHGFLHEARAAFQVALAINPHLPDLREIVRELSPETLMLH